MISTLTMINPLRSNKNIKKESKLLFRFFISVRKKNSKTIKISMYVFFNNFGWDLVNASSQVEIIFLFRIWASPPWLKISSRIRNQSNSNIQRWEIKKNEMGKKQNCKVFEWPQSSVLDCLLKRIAKKFLQFKIFLVIMSSVFIKMKALAWQLWKKRKGNNHLTSNLEIKLWLIKLSLILKKWLIKLFLNGW